MTFYIYQIINKTSGKLYIGKTNNINRRWTRHRNYPFLITSNKRNECPKLYPAIRKYGINAFDFQIISEYNSEQECCQAEIEFIQKFDSIKNGYNISEGGDGVSSGQHHPFYGKKHTIESRQKISQSKLGKKMGPASEERKSKISQALTGKEKLHTKGQNNPASKLKDDDIRLIRKLIADGNTVRYVSELFGVSDTLIRGIIKVKIWTHVL